LFSDAVLFHHPNETVTSVHKCMANYMKLAPHRTDGAGKGCHFQNQMISDDVEDPVSS
jgi:hypothetical protein